MRKRSKSADAAPTQAEERASRSSLRSAPLVRRRLLELGYHGTLVRGWTPPVVQLVARHA